MGRIAGLRARALVTLALVLLWPVLAQLSEATVTLSGTTPLLWLPFGLSLVYLFAVGPWGGVAVAAVQFADAVLRGGADPSLATAAVTAASVGAVVLVVAVMERRGGARGPARDHRAVIGFILLGAGVAPTAAWLAGTAAALVVGAEAMGPGTRTVAQAVLADGLAVLVLTTGLHLLLRPALLDVERRTVRAVAVASAGTLALTAVIVSLGGFDALLSSYFVAAPIFVLAVLSGTAAYSIAVAGGGVAVIAIASLAGPLTIDMPTGGHLSWWLICAAALLLAAEGDRRNGLTREYEILFSASTVATAEVLTTTGVVLRGNPALSELTGYATADLVGRPLESLFVAEDGTVPAWRGLLQGEVEGLATDVELRRRSGQPRYVRLSGNRVRLRGAAPDVLIVQLTDLTDERRREEALRRSNEALEQFGRRVSHDLQQPLSSISGYARTLLEHGDRLDDALVRTMHERLDAAARRASEQLDQVFASAEVGGGGLLVVHLPDIVTSVVGLLEIDLTEAGAKVTTAFSVRTVRADPVIVKQVLLNLVTNALKYAVPGLPPEIRVSARARGAGVELSVTDNGTGVPPDQLEHVFLPGSRLAPDAADGRGVGLFDSRGLVEAVGGWMRAEPWPEGARFVVWLPDPVTHAEHTQTVRVLLVDDETEQRMVMRAGLELEPQLDVVGEAASVREAVTATAQLRPDVVLLDRWLPDGDGLEAVGDLTRAHGDVRVIVLTSDVTPGLAELARAGGVLRTMDKRRSTDEIVRQLVDAGS